MNVEKMTREQLLNLTARQLEGLTNAQLKKIADQLFDKLLDEEIEELPKDVLEKLPLKRESTFLGMNIATWIMLIVGAIVATIIQAAQGR